MDLLFKNSQQKWRKNIMESFLNINLINTQINLSGFATDESIKPIFDSGCQIFKLFHNFICFFFLFLDWNIVDRLIEATIVHHIILIRCNFYCCQLLDFIFLCLALLRWQRPLGPLLMLFIDKLKLFIFLMSELFVNLLQAAFAQVR